MSERISDAELADCIEVARQEAESFAAHGHGRTRIKADTLAALRELAELREQVRWRPMEQAREFMREQRKVFNLSDDTYHRDLGLLADFVAHVAGVCERCHGSKLVTIRGMCGGVEMDCDDQPCPECEDIREAAK